MCVKLCSPPPPPPPPPQPLWSCIFLHESFSHMNYHSIIINHHSCLPAVSGNLRTSEELLELFRRTARTHCTPGVTTVGMVGYPNVGKSSTINTILQTKKVPVSATPGRTKHFQVRVFWRSCLCAWDGLEIGGRGGGTTIHCKSSVTEMTSSSRSLAMCRQGHHQNDWTQTAIIRRRSVANVQTPPCPPPPPKQKNKTKMIKAAGQKWHLD